MLRIAIVLLLLSFLTIEPFVGCECQGVSDVETTYWGSSISSSVEAGEGRLLKSARGVIKGSDGKPISGVLVELFEAPGRPRSHFGPEYKRARMAACQPGADGKFCFV